MCDRFNANKLAINMLIVNKVIKVPKNETNEKKYLLAGEGWDLLSELVPLLNKIANVYEIMSGDKYATLSMVYPTVMQFLIEHLIVFDGENETVKRFKLTFADALNSRYEPENESIANSPALISSFLDARYKHLDCISSNIRGLTFETIKLKMQEIVVEKPE
jgi:hypothetical protein